MLRKTLAMFLIAALVSGCYRTTIVQAPPGANRGPGDSLIGITLKDGEEIEFDRAATILDGVILASVSRAQRQFPLSEVDRIWLERRERDNGRSIATVILVPLAVVGGIFLLALATKESCPFVYSWDGEMWRFDGEPYGGAISRGLERDDFSRLELLRPVDGEYRLLVRNEVPETQHTNMMELLVVDHAPEVRVVPEATGKLATIGAAAPPLSAVDQNGRDLLPTLSATDRRIWEPEPRSLDAPSARHELTMTFARPPGAESVKLIAHIGTGLWGSHMIRELLSLRGRELAAWYETIDGDAEAALDVHRWGAREELYVLQVLVDVDGRWVPRGQLLGGGPFITEDRVLRLDVSDVEGDEIRIRLRPPGGFWAMNSFAIDASPDQSVPIERVAAKMARTDHGLDLRANLAAADEHYYVQPKIGDQAELRFDAPPQAAGTTRSIFLHSRGWYRLHLEPDGPADEHELQRIVEVPDGGARLAAELYATRPSQQTALQPR